MIYTTDLCQYVYGQSAYSILDLMGVGGRRFHYASS